MVSNVIQLVLTAGVMFTLSWQITAAVAGPAAGRSSCPARRVGQRLAEITRESYQLDAKMNATMTERFGVAGALLVKLFGRPEVEARRFAGRAARVRDIGIQRRCTARTFFVAMMLVASLAQALTYGLGGWLAVTGTVSAGTVVTLALLLTRLYGPLTALSNVRVDVMSALVSFERVFEVLDLRAGHRREAGRGRRCPRGTAGSSSATCGSATRPRPRCRWPRWRTSPRWTAPSPSRCCAGVSFTVEPGQMVALVGPSGAGKSTTVDAGAPDLRRDRRRGAGRRRRRPRRHARTRCATRSAWSPRTRTCSTRRSRRTCATPSRTPPTTSCGPRCDGAQVGDLVRSLPDGLDTVVGERGYRFSGGEKQRIAIARLLLKAPSIVILDEATAHLDSRVARRPCSGRCRWRWPGRTALVIAHRLSTVRDADQILVLDDGRIVERARHDELVAAGGLYAELYRTQFAVADSPTPFVDATGAEPVITMPMATYVADEAMPPAAAN